ncbi:hypothetical protein TWF506_008641 [Arthrobotrys conoides]|uniref:GAF domain-containing protein n=1 Tax=Arthrobotrys conoides TaxID=74498 RepID=A0AAN8NDM3_9PEZI
MVHADATHFGANVSKQDAYEQVIEQLQSLMDGQKNWLTFGFGIHLGFYVRDGPDNLILGPFQGRVACQTISFSRGVCGRAARTAETQIVDDVHSDASHVACDSSTKSEIVVPILFNDEVVGVIDIDCEDEKGFTGEDREALERIAMLLAAGCDWASLRTK